MSYSNFTPANLKKFRAEFAKFIEQFEEDNEVKINLGNISYSGTQFTTKLTVTIVKEGEDPQEAIDRKSLRDHGYAYGIEENDYGTIVTLNRGIKAKLVAIKPRSRKYPIIVEAENGSRYKIPVSQIAHLLGQNN